MSNDRQYPYPSVNPEYRRGYRNCLAIVTEIIEENKYRNRKHLLSLLKSSMCFLDITLNREGK